MKKQFLDYGKRFSDDKVAEVLGTISNIPTIRFPDIERTYRPKGQILTYKMIKDSNEFDRVAEIYRQSISEMCGTATILMN
jgi:hypothetical protein